MLAIVGSGEYDRSTSSGVGDVLADESEKLTDPDSVAIDVFLLDPADSDEAPKYCALLYKLISISSEFIEFLLATFKPG